MAHPLNPAFTVQPDDLPGPLIAPDTETYAAPAGSLRLSDRTKLVSTKYHENTTIPVVGLFELLIESGKVGFLGAVLRASKTSHFVSVATTDSVPLIRVLENDTQITLIGFNNLDGHVKGLENLSAKFDKIWTVPGSLSPHTFHAIGGHATEIANDLQGSLSFDVRGREDGLWPHLTWGPMPRILVTGGQGTGKSTLCRRLVNELLTATRDCGPGGSSQVFSKGVMFLDLDPLSSEFAGPGIISLCHIVSPLFGPAYTNIIVPGTDNKMMRAHFVNHEGPTTFYYEDCVEELIDRCYRHPGMSREMPLVIHTDQDQAYTLNDMWGQRGLVDEITHTFDLGGTPGGIWLPPWENLRSISQSTPAHIVQATSQEDRVMMQVQSYLHARHAVRGRVTWEPKPLRSLRECDMIDITDDVFYFHFIGQNVNRPGGDQTVHNTVVAIIVIAPTSDTNQVPYLRGLGGSRPRGTSYIKDCKAGFPHSVFDSGQRNGEPNPDHTECIGLGFLRIVPTDQERARMFIYSPVSALLQQHVALHHKIALMVPRGDRLWPGLPAALEEELQKTGTIDEWGL